MKNVRVIIADDHPIVRSGIRHELEKYGGFDVLEETDNADDALSLTLRHKPDVLILDMNMPGETRVIDVIRHLKEIEHHSRILVITAYKEAAVVIGSIQAGADGYLLKEEDIESIPVAVHTVVKGDAWVSQGVTNVLTSQMKASSQRPQITERESQVLLLLTEGLKNDEIGKELGISRRTVEFHMTNIMSKLNLDSRGKVIAWAKKNLHMKGMVRPSEP